MDIVMGLLVVGLLIVGLAGSVLPFLPGIPLIFAGAVLHALANEGEPIGIGRLMVLAIMGATAYAMDYGAGVLGAKRAGGSRWAIIGAVLGGLVGLCFGLAGLILGPIAGAILGELLRSGEVRTSIRAGVGTALGILVGGVAKLALALSMAGLILWWIWQG
jgi:hypothetical protein